MRNVGIRKSLIATTTLVAATGALTTWALSGYSDQVSTVPGTQHAARIHPISATSAPMPAIGDQACDLGAALPKPSAHDSFALETWTLNEASQPLQDGVKPLTRDTAIALAGQMANDPSAAGTTISAAAELPYSKVESLMGIDGTDGLVAPTRCVWAVTVAAPFSPRSVLPGTKIPVYDAFTAVFDEATGEYLDLSAGPEAINLISGANLDRR